MKKKTLFGWLGVCAVLIMAACNFQIPESVTVKGEPGVYLPLGNPFTGEGNMTVTDYFDINTIRDLVVGTQAGVTMYSYKSDSFLGVQTYLVHSQIAEMDLNLSEYVKQLDITDETGTAMPDTFIPGGLPVPITIPFGQMAEWVTEVEDAQFTVTLTFKDNNVPTDVSVTFNINGENKDGIKDASDLSKLIFTHDSLSDDLHPQEHNGIFINITVPLGYSFKPKLEFDWKSATIQPKKGDDVNYKENYNFSIGELINYLGKGVSFETIPTYMYVDLPKEAWDAQITLSVDGGEPSKKGIVQGSMPDITLNDDEIASIDFQGDPFEFADFLSSLDDGKVKESINLQYEMATEQVTIHKDDTKLGTITIDLIIVLPLQFEVSGLPTIPESLDDEKKADLARYVKLELGDLLPNMDGGDLFGRTTGKEDDLFESLDYVKIYLNNCRNTIIPGGFSISIIADTYSNLFTLDKGITIDLDELPNPFSPKFEILIPKIPGENYGTLSIGSGTPEFDFSLVVDAKAKIDQTITF
jgi:hypothetical protein